MSAKMILVNWSGGITSSQERGNKWRGFISEWPLNPSFQNHPFSRRGAKRNATGCFYFSKWFLCPFFWSWWTALWVLPGEEREGFSLNITVPSRQQVMLFQMELFLNRHLYFVFSFLSGWDRKNVKCDWVKSFYWRSTLHTVCDIESFCCCCSVFSARSDGAEFLHITRGLAVSHFHFCLAINPKNNNKQSETGNKKQGEILKEKPEVFDRLE